MSESDSSAILPESSPDVPHLEPSRREWIYRAAAGLCIVLLSWFTYRHRHDGGVLLLVAPFLIGAVITALRLQSVSGTVNSIEKWFKRGSARASEREGKFARLFQRPFFCSCLTVWHRTTPISDVHLRAGVRTTILIFICGIAINLFFMALYIFIVIAVLVIGFLIFGWILSLSNPGSPKVVTRDTTDWVGRPKQEHFDETGQKIGESRPDTDWLGQSKMVHEDAEGNFVGESKPDTDWLGNPKTVHTNAEGTCIGESAPGTDWFGTPKSIHTDADGNIVGESREETNIFGQRQTVHYEK